MSEQRLQIIFWPSRVISLLGQLLCGPVQSREPLHQHQRPTALVHDNTAHCFGVSGMVGQGYEVSCGQNAAIDAVNAEIKLCGINRAGIVYQHYDLKRFCRLQSLEI
jgi:hypothetical protein